MVKNMKKRNQRRRGFTLLEVLMVLVILGVIAVLVLTQLGNTGQRANIDAARIAVTGTISSAIERYKMHMQHYPTADEGGLRALLEKPSDEEAGQKWAGPYANPEQLKDPWGKDYEYQFPGQYNEGSFDLNSAGPDGVSGNDDDVTNWKKT